MNKRRTDRGTDRQTDRQTDTHRATMPHPPVGPSGSQLSPSVAARGEVQPRRPPALLPVQATEPPQHGEDLGLLGVAQVPQQDLLARGAVVHIKNTPNKDTWYTRINTK